jgi:hypothetical protein
MCVVPMLADVKLKKEAVDAVSSLQLSQHLAVVPTSFLTCTQYTFGFQIRFFQAGKLEEPGEPVGSLRIDIHVSDQVKEEEADSES